MADPCLCGQRVLPYDKGWGRSRWVIEATLETGFPRWHPNDGPCVPRVPHGQQSLFDQGT